MTRTKWVLFAVVAIALVAQFAVTSFSAANAAPAPKVTLCHVPPGNPENNHTISVSGNALAVHLAHGDLQFFLPQNCN